MTVLTASPVDLPSAVEDDLRAAARRVALATAANSVQWGTAVSPGDKVRQIGVDISPAVWQWFQTRFPDDYPLRLSGLLSLYIGRALRN
jgi:hypothetical protein